MLEELKIYVHNTRALRHRDKKESNTPTPAVNYKNNIRRYREREGVEARTREAWKLIYTAEREGGTRMASANGV